MAIDINLIEQQNSNEPGSAERNSMNGAKQRSNDYDALKPLIHEEVSSHDNSRNLPSQNLEINYTEDQVSTLQDQNESQGHESFMY